MYVSGLYLVFEFFSIIQLFYDTPYQFLSHYICLGLKSSTVTLVKGFCPLKTEIARFAFEFRLNALNFFIKKISSVD